MTDADLERLLPCPFCGAGHTWFHQYQVAWSSIPVGVSVMHVCSGLSSHSRAIERMGKDVDEAVELWNMRVSNG
jgi:hypothetical protein